MAGISIRNIEKRFGSFRALNGVSLEVEPGEFTVLLGPSGCGKTTLLRIVAGLEHEDSGEVYMGSRDVTALSPRHRNIAMVFQNYAVFPHMDVYKNVSFGLKMRKVPKEELQTKTERALALMHIEALAKRYPSQLSGGQRQRVAVARALAYEPQVLLMDEPLSNLDALLRLEMRAELKQLLVESKTTTLYVTHDQLEAMSLASRIAVMQDGELVQYAPPKDVYSNPKSKFVGSFIGNPPMNFIRLADASDRTRATANASGAPRNREGISMGIRPEDLALADASPSMLMQVAVVEELGAALHATGTVDGQLVRVVLDADAEVRMGGEIELQPNPKRVRWFDEQGGLIDGD